MTVLCYCLISLYVYHAVPSSTLLREISLVYRKVRLQLSISLAVYTFFWCLYLCSLSLSRTQWAFGSTRWVLCETRHLDSRLLLRCQQPYSTCQGDLATCPPPKRRPFKQLGRPIPWGHTEEDVWPFSTLCTVVPTAYSISDTIGRYSHRFRRETKRCECYGYCLVSTYMALRWGI